MSSYAWTINGRTYDTAAPLPVSLGQRVRMVLRNDSMMWHPMHLHGHTFQMHTSDGSGARKDTTIVRPMQTVTVDFNADNPGRWMLHCHNAYHAEAGMTTRLEYRL
jgi:FtsP/CotA-like multicopper oxidase with cupredoxin domain